MRKRLLAVFVFISCFAVVFSGCSGKVENDIRSHAANNNEFTLGEVFDFDWDIAYIDPAPWDKGIYLKTKYGLDFEPMNFISNDFDVIDSPRVIYFFKDGHVVSKGQLTFGMVPLYIEVFTPATVAYSQWAGESDATLSLSISNTFLCERSILVSGDSFISYINSLYEDETIGNFLEYGYPYAKRYEASCVIADISVNAEAVLSNLEVIFFEDNNGSGRNIYTSSIAINSIDSKMISYNAFTGNREDCPFDIPPATAVNKSSLETSAVDVFRLCCDNISEGEIVRIICKITSSPEKRNVMDCTIYEHDGSVHDLSFAFVNDKWISAG